MYCPFELWYLTVFLVSKFDDIPPHERDTSEQLMDDIDEMLKDLNKELDELIPGM